MHGLPDVRCSPEHRSCGAPQPAEARGDVATVAPYVYGRQHASMSVVGLSTRPSRHWMTIFSSTKVRVPLPRR